MMTSPYPSASPQVLGGGWKERWHALRRLPAVLHIVWEAGSTVLVASIVMRIAAALIPLGILATSRKIIDAIVGALSHHSSIPQGLWPLVALEFSLAVLASVLSRTTDFFETLLADRFSRHVSVRVMEHSARLDLAHYEDPAFYDKLERARAQATDRIGMLQAMGLILQEAVTAITLSASILMFSPWLLLILIVCVVPAFLGESHFAFLGYTLSFEQTPVRRELDYLRMLGASKEAAKEMKLFGLSSFLIDRFRDLSQRIYEENTGLARRRLWTGAGLSLLSTAGYYAAYTYVIYRTVSGAMSVGTMTFLAGVIAGARLNIQSIFSQAANVADQALFVTDLLDFLAVRPALQSRPDALQAPRPIREGFEFRQVSFSYPGTSRLVLDRLNFRLGRGERIAIIGENGQGKTTIVKLLTRLYDPTGGGIFLDGVDLRDYKINELRSEIGVIFQDFMRYEMTAKDNIAVGRIADRNHIASIRGAASKSLADEVIAKLPEGYGQMLGRRFEGGIDLSIGEWQKLALARAYLRDAQVLVLDEPTASLDARSEDDVFQRFSELTRDKMALLISHRFSTVKMADNILVLAGGKIAEEGSHRELISRGGLYSEMFELQAANYR